MNMKLMAIAFLAVAGAAYAADVLKPPAAKKLPKSGKRRICFPITSRAYYGRSQLLIRKLHEDPDVDLELMLGGSILLDKYSRHIADDIKAGGFTIAASNKGLALADINSSNAF